MSATTVVLPALDNTMGALYLGVILAMGLWGAGCVQMYYYFNRYPKDDWRVKLLVVVVWCLDTMHQGLISHTCYIYLITNYANPLFLNEIVKSLLIMVLVSGIICLLVQIFLVLRVWKLSHKNIPTVAILTLLVVAEFICVLAYFGKASTFTTFTELPQIVNLSRVVNVLSAASDIGIAFVLIFLLQRSRTGFRRSETIINRLIIFTINTGLLTSMCAVMSLITITVYPNTFIYITFFLCISKLYTNTLFATLNARKSASGGMPDDTENGTGSMSMGNMRTGPRATDFATRSGTRTYNEHMLQIKVNTETTHLSDAKGQPQQKTPSDSDTDVIPYPYDQKNGNFMEP